LLLWLELDRVSYYRLCILGCPLLLGPLVALFREIVCEWEWIVMNIYLGVCFVVRLLDRVGFRVGVAAFHGFRVSLPFLRLDLSEF